MKKLDEIVSVEKLYEMLGKELPRRKCNPVIKIFAGIGMLATAAAAVYGVWMIVENLLFDDYEDMEEIKDEAEDGEEDFFVDEE